MIKKIIKVIKLITLFLVFWFLNSGFLVQPAWLVLQAVFFTVVTEVVFKYSKVKLMYWFYLVGLFYAVSAILEIFKVSTFPEIMASTGFGLLVILLVYRVLIRGK